MVHVNGEPHVGNVSGYGNMPVPVLFKKGKDDLFLVGGGGRPKRQATHKCTFTSRSTARCSTMPSSLRSVGDETERPALVLSLHGEAVEAIGQAGCYSL